MLLYAQSTLIAAFDNHAISKIFWSDHKRNELFLKKKIDFYWIFFNGFLFILRVKKSWKMKYVYV